MEIAEITEVFGNDAPRFSTYVKSGTVEGESIRTPRGAISGEW
jgi:hypothetical protein